MRNVSKTISNITPNLSLKKHTIHTAQLLFECALDNNLLIGRSKKAMICACIYASCQVNKSPKQMRDIAYYGNTEPKKALKALKMLKKTCKVPIPHSTAEELIEPYIIKLKFDFEARNYAMKSLTIIQENNLMEGKSPITIVATILYLTSKEKGLNITQREIASLTGVVEVTIRKRCKELKTKL